MKGPVTASRRDLHTLAGIVSEDRGEPPVDGVAPSLLGDLLGLIRCVLFEGHDSSKQLDWFGQLVPAEDHDDKYDGESFWQHYWSSPCCYPDRTGDLRRLIRISDFYSARGTVGTHLENIYRQLQVTSRTAAVIRALGGPAREAR